MPTTDTCAGTEAASPRGGDGLCVELRIRPPDELGCPLQATEGPVVGHDVVCRNGTCEFGCECRATVTTETGTEFVGREIRDDCLCPVFRSHDCVASIRAVESGEFVVDLSVPSRGVLTDVVDGLRSRDAAVELRRIAESAADDDRRRVTIDADAITEKQREAIEVAFEEGYYERPRRADLADLADRLGVTRSAVSQRLTAAEATLVEALYDLESSVDD